MQLDSLHEGFNGWFASSGKCDHCHGKDPNEVASVDLEGGDINLVDDWRSTMMANSARDPFWRAKVSHEILINPGLQVEIENTCTRCHASLGHFGAMLNGQENYSISEMVSDQIALDGVSCVSCHQQSSEGLGNQFTGELNFITSSLAYGQYESPLITPMALYSGYTPEYSPHISDAGLCAACHTLITPAVDLEGNLTGDTFVEQATYHEWLNSSYSETDLTCQECHMPSAGDMGVILAAGFDTPPRTPFSKHGFAGANVTMLGILRDNIETLDIPATVEQFDETISKTFEMLQQKSLDLTVDLAGRTDDTVFVDVKLVNKAGHKLPSGYPARKMSVHFVVSDSLGNVLFQSGGFDGDYYLADEDVPFEAHHDIIHQEDQVQVYEMVMGDVNGNETTVLNRGFSHLKDNRLVPLGFSILNSAYDTTEIAGISAEDLDFNHDPIEGSGSDVIHYHVGTGNYDGAVTVDVSVYYQSLPPTWMEEIFSAETPEIDIFSGMFDAADKSPVLMKQEELEIEEFVGIQILTESSWFDVNTIHHSQIKFFSTETGTLHFYNSQGKLVYQRAFTQGNGSISLQLARGTYVLKATSKSGEVVIQKVVIGS